MEDKKAILSFCREVRSLDQLVTFLYGIAVCVLVQVVGNRIQEDGTQKYIVFGLETNEQQ